jgi:hypothetical protein
MNKTCQWARLAFEAAEDRTRKENEPFLPRARCMRHAWPPIVGELKIGRGRSG